MRRHFCLFALLVLALSTIWSSVPVLADVTIKGNVTFYDSLRYGYRPAKNVLVEVNGDWWDLDPRVHTDDNGNFTATQRDPWWGDFDINIDAYAQTQGKVSIYEWWGAWAAYHAGSATVENVNGGQTCTINLRIGGPQNNAVSTYCRSIAENANAFLIEQEILEHYRKLSGMGFPDKAFQDTDVIAPAMGQTSYYNHFTDFINLTYGSLCGKTGWSMGNEDWSTLDKGQSSYIPYQYVLDMARHESSHRIHNQLTTFAPLGLNIPASHSPSMETNEFLALTEGFASFMPLTTIPTVGIYEPTPSKYLTGLKISPEPASFHNSCEGDVTALLLDLYDPANIKEPMRTIAEKSVTGDAAPEQVMRDQNWTDRLSDPNLGRIRSVIGITTNWVWPIQTINDFLNSYRANYPQDSHALKTIAYNRYITMSTLPERQPYINGGINIGRADSGLIWVKFDLTEWDPEDRPFASVSYWRQNGATVSQVKAATTYPDAWSNMTRTVIQSLQVSNGQGANDKLWIVLSDEMLSTAYCVQVPDALPGSSDDNSGSDDSGSSGNGHRNPWDRRFIEVPRPKALGPDPGPENARTRDKGAPSAIPVALQQMDSADQRAKATALRTAIRQARAEMQSYADAQELAGRVDRALRGMAKSLGGVQLAGTTGDRAFQQWLGQLSAGKGLKQPLSAGAKSAIAAQLKLVTGAFQTRQGAGARAQEMNSKLSAAFSAVTFGSDASLAQRDVTAAVKGIQTTLTKLSSDTALSGRLQQQSTAMQSLAR